MSPLLVALLLQAGYDDLVARGVELGRNGRLEEARLSLDRAVAMRPKEACAWRERGGLNFLRKDYAAATRDLEKAWELRHEDYTARMLGNSLYLQGHHAEALEAWNEAGVPLVNRVRVEGEQRLPSSMVRREVTASEGGLLTAAQFRESRLRLEETGSFRGVLLRPVPLEEGKADLEVNVREAHGFGTWYLFAGRQAANAFSKKVRLTYHNVVPGITLGAEHKWEDTQPRLAGSLEWVRPAGIGVNTRLYGITSRPEYDLEGPLTMRSHGADVAVRRVLGPATVGELGFRTRTRTFTRTRPDTPDGRWSGLDVALDRHLLQEGRHRALASARFFHTVGALGSDLDFGRALALARYEGALAGYDGSVMPGSQLAVRVLLGRGSAGTPLDEMFAPGTASEADYPVRGRKQKTGGVLGPTAIGRDLSLVNVEWRQRLLRFGASVKLGAVAFYDGARVRETAQGADTVYHDAGGGLRLSIGSSLFRLDYGVSLTGDGKNALTVGIGQVF